MGVRKNKTPVSTVGRHGPGSFGKRLEGEAEGKGGDELVVGLRCQDSDCGTPEAFGETG